MRKEIIALARRGDRGHGQHPGLLLQRFLSGSATGENGDPDEKRSLLKDAIDAAGDSYPWLLYKSAYARWEKRLSELTLTSAKDFVTDGRLIVGLGSENVLETGIRLHHTYGLPVIPGSALKGLAAHYCHEVWGQSSPSDEGKKFRKPTTDEDKAYRKYLQEQGDIPAYNFHRLLFGTTDDSGCLIFHDAWLRLDSSSPLVMDVMTPHHPKWLDGGKPPTDFDSPVPVPFVSVSGIFRVAVSWHGPVSEKASCWTKLGFDLLAEALREWGVGGKTSSGYGRLIASETASSAVQPPTDRPAARTASPPVQLKSLQLVDATLVEDPKGKGRRFARHTTSGLVGPIQNQEAVPPDKKVDDKVSLVVASISSDNKHIQFRWPSGEQPKSKKPEQGPPRGGPGRLPPKRR